MCSVRAILVCSNGGLKFSGVACWLRMRDKTETRIIGRARSHTSTAVVVVEASDFVWSAETAPSLTTTAAISVKAMGTALTEPKVP